MDEETVLSALHEGRVFQGLQVLGRIGQRQAHFRGKGLDGSFALCEELEHLEPAGIRQGLAEPRELGVEPILEFPVRVPHIK